MPKFWTISNYWLTGRSPRKCLVSYRKKLIILLNHLSDPYCSYIPTPFKTVHPAPSTWLRSLSSKSPCLLLCIILSHHAWSCNRCWSVGILLLSHAWWRYVEPASTEWNPDLPSASWSSASRICRSLGGSLDLAITRVGKPQSLSHELADNYVLIRV